MHLRQPAFTYSTCSLFTKNKEKIQKLKKQRIQDVFIKIDYIKLVLSMKMIMDILQVYLKEHILIKYYHIILLKTQNVKDINGHLLQ